MYRNQKGSFDGIEVLVIILIIGTLAAVSIPPVARVWSGYHRTSVVVVHGKEVFRGHAACVEVKSAGAATEVDIAAAPLCLWSKDHFVENDIKVETH